MYRLLSEGLFVYNDFTICNFTLLDDKDFLKVFESNTVYVYDNCRDEAKYFVNKIIRDIIIDDRFIDIQFSFFRDNRDRRGCTRKQLDILSDILFNNYEYELNDTQLTFLSKQRRGIVQKIIDTFKDTEFIFWMPGHVTKKNNRNYSIV